MRRLLAAAAVLTLTACITDSVAVVGTQAIGGDGSSSGSLPGTYTLKTVDAKALPFTVVQTATEKDEVLDDAFTLTSANTFSRIEHIRQTINGTTTILVGTDAGTFAKTASGDYEFTPQNVPPFTATIVNGVMTAPRRNTAGVFVPSVYSK